MRFFPWFASLIFLSLAACHSAPTHPVASAEEQDPYRWLEDVESPRSLEWVKARNETSEHRIEGTAAYKTIEGDLKKILLAKDRLPSVTERGGWLYNFWQDEKNVRGVWRRTRIAEFRKKTPRWETLLDLDELARKENENWVWHGSDCLAPEGRDCLVFLSRGGKDAHVTREFDIAVKRFVPNGFLVPEAKASVGWVDQNTVLVSTDNGPGTLTTSGYPRQVKLLKRAQPMAEARLVFEAPADSMEAEGATSITPDGRWVIITHHKTFFTEEQFLMTPDLHLTKLPIPDDAILDAVFRGHAIFRLRSAWTNDGRAFAAGSVLAMKLDSPSSAVSLVFAPTAKISAKVAAATKSGLFIGVLDHVRGHILRAFPPGEKGSPPGGAWRTEDVSAAGGHHLELQSTDAFSDVLLANAQDFLAPPALVMAETGGEKVRFTTLKTLPPRFDAKPFVTEQLETTSPDGTRIPYFVVRPKDLRFDGQAPTVLYSYGGFETPLTPNYLATIGKIWLERQHGVYVVANIRGGGEFGPEWHSSVLKQNRQKVFDDFAAVAEDLVRRKITSAGHLGITGRSNGGLLMGAEFTQHPDLFKAVVCGVPLLDMLRYHKLLAGASWMDEYGNPDDPTMAEAIRKYSPYQNIRSGVKYPDILFLTSMKDDRVHPGHARKAAAKMLELNQPVLFWENIEGGHAGSANIQQRVRFDALSWAFLASELTTSTPASASASASEPSKQVGTR